MPLCAPSELASRVENCVSTRKFNINKLKLSGFLAFLALLQIIKIVNVAL